MNKPLSKIEAEYEARHIQKLAAKNKEIKRILEAASRDIAQDLRTFKIRIPEGGFRVYRYNAGLEKKIDAALKIANTELETSLIDSIKSQWTLANEKNNQIIDELTGTVPETPDTAQRVLSAKQLNLDALSVFIDRKVAGMNLSKRVWNLTQQNKELLEVYLGSGITTGKSAVSIAQDIKTLLIEPDKLFRRVRDAEGQPLHLSKAAQAYHPGQGVYRSSFQNALRLTATEGNMAYRMADYERRQQLPFVTGIEIHLSGSHPEVDICDAMQGKYPAGFIFGGWHPRCYSSDTEVYTKNGWKLFKDVLNEDLILSLNPETKNLEYVKIKEKVEYIYTGQMMRFSSRSLDLMVTPNHNMVCFSKHNHKLIEMPASDYYKKLRYIESRKIYGTEGILYRSSEWVGQENNNIKIGKYDIPTELFCEFMGYYLSEGSYSRKYAIIISQFANVNPDKYKIMEKCLSQMPFSVHCKPAGFFIYDKDFWEYLIQFGKSFNKHIPDCIKELDANMIEIFLQAFCIGDGSIKINKKWKNGNFKESRTFSTSSKKMADDLGELLLKIGHHPSFGISSKKGRLSNHQNGTYASKNEQILVADCYSNYASQFYKETIDYSDMVYDVELEKNHILYVRRNGKCVWGSNCLCYTTSVMLSRDEIKAYFLTGDIDSRRYIRSIPETAAKYVQGNAEKLDNLKNKPYWAVNFNKDWSYKRRVKL